MIAVVSDLHANLEALRAVLSDIRSMDVRRVLCLGDVVGYGPDPRKVVDLTMRFHATVRGNHDQAVVRNDVSLFARLVARGISWTRRRLRPRHRRYSRKGIRRWRFLRELPTRIRMGDLLLTHGSPTDIFEYVVEPEQALRIFREEMDGARLCLLGHTHVPAVFVERGNDVRVKTPEPGRWYRIRRSRAIVNVGSVGQPRDGDPRASYLLLRDDGALSFRRVPYDVDRTVDKIFRARGLADVFGDRLVRGE